MALRHLSPHACVLRKQCTKGTDKTFRGGSAQREGTREAEQTQQVQEAWPRTMEVLTHVTLHPPSSCETLHIPVRRRHVVAYAVFMSV